MFANWKIFLEFFFQKYFFQKYFCDNIFGENIFVKIFFDHFGNFFSEIFLAFWRKYFCENIFVENILVKIFFDHSLITKGFPFLTKFPLLHLHPFEVKCDERTDAMSVPFICSIDIDVITEEIIYFSDH